MQVGNPIRILLFLFDNDNVPSSSNRYTLSSLKDDTRQRSNHLRFE